MPLLYELRVKRASEVSLLTRRPEQYWQPKPRLTRAATAAFQRCDLSSRQIQCPTRLEPRTSSDTGTLFAFGSHSAARSGRSNARELVIETRRPAQKGQPVFTPIRLAGVACHR